MVCGRAAGCLEQKEVNVLFAIIYPPIQTGSRVPFTLRTELVFRSKANKNRDLPSNVPARLPL